MLIILQQSSEKKDIFIFEIFKFRIFDFKENWDF